MSRTDKRIWYVDLTFLTAAALMLIAQFIRFSWVVFYLALACQGSSVALSVWMIVRTSRRMRNRTS